MSGHGHVTPNPGGLKARCGGPGLCPKCALELLALAPEDIPTRYTSLVERLRGENKEPKQEIDMGLKSGVGMPAYIHLDLFGHMVNRAFDADCYLVGSALETNTPRDIDVRLILDDAIFDTMFPNGDRGRIDIKWASMCAAFSALGKEMTGLPIDFQIQRQSNANKKYPHRREPLGMSF